MKLITTRYYFSLWVKSRVWEGTHQFTMEKTFPYKFHYHWYDEIAKKAADVIAENLVDFSSMNLLDVRGPRPGFLIGSIAGGKVRDPRDVPDSGNQGPCIHCGHMRSGVDGAGQCVLCVMYIWMK